MRKIFIIFKSDIPLRGNHLNTDIINARKDIINHLMNEYGQDAVKVNNNKGKGRRLDIPSFDNVILYLDYLKEYITLGALLIKILKDLYKYLAEKKVRSKITLDIDITINIDQVSLTNILKNEKQIEKLDDPHEIKIFLPDGSEYNK